MKTSFREQVLAAHSILLRLKMPDVAEDNPTTLELVRTCFAALSEIRHWWNSQDTQEIEAAAIRIYHNNPGLYREDSYKLPIRIMECVEEMLGAAWTMAPNGSFVPLNEYTLASVCEAIGRVEVPGAIGRDDDAATKRDIELQCEAIQMIDNYSPPESPSEWAKRFGISTTTLNRRVEDGEIRVQKVTLKSWRIHNDDVRNNSK